MTSTWTDGYRADTTYTYGYYNELSPALQRFCMILKGFAPAPQGAAGPTYCEMGFGQGISLNIHAAAAPGTYVGNDFNPSHAAFAQSLTQQSGTNLRVLEDSFEEMCARTDLPAFDHIGLHGIWSWISDENKSHIVTFARKHLKPGGVLYLSYNALPGRAASGPLRHLLSSYDEFAQSDSNPESRTRQAIDFATSSLQHSIYKNTVPWIMDAANELRNQDPNYLLNEYFNAHWDSVYFLDMVKWLGDAKLTFCASAQAIDNIPDVAITAEGQATLQAIAHPLLREQVRDYLVNKSFRKDLFVKGPRRLNFAEQNALLLDTRFMLRCQPEAVKYEIEAGMGKTTLDQHTYSNLVNALASDNFAPKSGHQLLELCELPLGQLFALLGVLVNASYVSPCQSLEQEATARPSAHRLNATLREIARSDKNISWLASPVLGAGVSINRIAQLFIDAMLSQQDPAQHAWHYLKTNNEVLVKDNAPIIGDHDNLAELSIRFTSFQSSDLPLCQAYGLL